VRDSLRIAASIQVRMGSGRFPGKVMRKVNGRPLLGFLIDRLRLCKTIDEIVVATSAGHDNDVIESFCSGEKIRCFRGSEDDVLGRTLGALESVSAVIGVEVFGDCPLIDPTIVDDAVRLFLSDPEYDFVGNDLKTTFPPGMEVEVFSVAALSKSDRLVSIGDPVREHGTLFIRQSPEIYRLKNIEAPANHFRPDMELEVDTVEDFAVVASVIEHFAGRVDFSLDEIILFLDAHPQITETNRHIQRRWREYRLD